MCYFFLSDRALESVQVWGDPEVQSGCGPEVCRQSVLFFGWRRWRGGRRTERKAWEDCSLHVNHLHSPDRCSLTHVSAAWGLAVLFYTECDVTVSRLCFEHPMSVCNAWVLVCRVQILWLVRDTCEIMKMSRCILVKIECPIKIRKCSHVNTVIKAWFLSFTGNHPPLKCSALFWTMKHCMSIGSALKLAI